MLLASFPNRVMLLTVAIAATLTAFLFAPFAWHSNYVSFSCIGLGALFASSPRVQLALQNSANILVWLAVIVALVIGPLYVTMKAMQAATPFLILYLVFAVALTLTAFAVAAASFLGFTLALQGWATTAPTTIHAPAQR
jgi:hypothetical protein